MPCMLQSGLCFGIVPPSCLELFRQDILAWHLWNVEWEKCYSSPRRYTSIFLTQHFHIQRCSEIVLKRRKSVEQKLFLRRQQEKAQEGYTPPLGKSALAAHILHAGLLLQYPYLTEMRHTSPFLSNITNNRNPNFKTHNFIRQL